MKNLFKEAHKMTREMVEKYGVDYQAQFGLVVSYLHEIKGDVETMTNFKGTEKQIKYATDIKEEVDAIFEVLEETAKTYNAKKETTREKHIGRIKEAKEFANMEDAGEYIETFKDVKTRKQTMKLEGNGVLKDILKENGFNITMAIWKEVQIRIAKMNGKDRVH